MLFIEAEKSIDEMLDNLWTAVNQKFGENTWLVKSFPDHVIIKQDMNMFKVDYTIEDDGSVTLGNEMTPVEVQFVVVTEAISEIFLEAADKTGKVWKVILIKAGKSANNNVYPSDVLRAATPLFEGVRALARSDSQHLQDAEKSVKNIVGWFENVKFENNALVATFTVSEAAEWLRVMLKDAWDNGKKDLVGLSIVAEGQGVLKKTASGLIREVESIDKVSSVDVVVDPAAGGGFIKLIAAQGDAGNKEKKDMDKAKLLEALKTEFPEIYKDVDQEKSTEAELQTLYTEAKEKKAKPAASPTAPAATVAPATPVAQRNDLIEGLQGQAQASLKQIKIMECGMLLSSSLADAKLPAPIINMIEARFKDKIFEPRELADEISNHKKMLAALSESGNVTGLGHTYEQGLDERNKVLLALDGFFEGKAIDKVAPFRFFREAYETITGDRDVTGRMSNCVKLHKFTEALTSSSFGDILGDSIARRMLAEYRVSPLNMWTQIVSEISSIKDFRSNPRMRMGGYGTLPAVAQSGPYDALNSPGDEQETFSISKRGGTETVTLEMIANDDQGAVRRIPNKLSRAALQTLFNFVFDILKNNPTLGVDSKALFHADHNNLGSAALSDTALTNTRIAMRSQTAFGDSANVLGLTPKILVVPNELEKLAWKLINSFLQVGSAESTPRFADTEDNFHRMHNMSVVVVDNWTDADDWVAVCDPKDCPTIEIGFFNGRQEPELFVQDNPSNGSVFTNDVITYKIRHIYGGIPLDFRGMFKHVV